MDYNLSYSKPKKKKNPLNRLKNLLYQEYNNNINKSKQKSHSYYYKIYNIKNESFNSDNGLNTHKKLKSRKSNIYSTEKVLQRTFQKKSLNASVFHWPKLTHPKLPFSKKKSLNLEERKQKISKLKPSLLFHDFYTVQWLRKKYGNSNIKKSIYSLLPNNGKPVIPDDESEKEKRHRLTMEFLENSKKTEENLKTFANINPKYLFDETTFEKILKLKEIFLEFDEDDSRKMEIDEMVKMFNDNHINANINELVKLFFKDRKYKKEEVMNLYLDFYQFICFALTKDQDFRNFMRGIKKKINNNNKNESQNQEYLPMSFNLVLDYFIAKGKERSSIEIIQNAMNEIDKIIKSNQNKKKEIFEENNLNFSGESATQLNILKNNKLKKNLNLASPLQPSKNLSSKKSMNQMKCNDIECDQSLVADSEKEVDNYDEQFKKINFSELLKEFAKLFESATNNTNEFTKIGLKNKQSKSVSNNNFKKSTELSSSMLLNDGGHLITEQCESSNFYVNSSPNNVNIKDLIKKQMDRNRIKKLYLANYDKFHDVRLALDTTKQQLNLFKRNKIINKEIKNISNSNKTSNNTFIDICQTRNNSVSNNNIKNIYTKKKEKPINFFLNKSKTNNRNDYKTNINNTQFQEYGFRKNYVNQKLKIKKLKTYFSYYAGVPHIMNDDLQNNDDPNTSIKIKKKPINDYVPIEFLK